MNVLKLESRPPSCNVKKDSTSVLTDSEHLNFSNMELTI